MVTGHWYFTGLYWFHYPCMFILIFNVKFILSRQIHIPSCRTNDVPPYCHIFISYCMDVSIRLRTNRTTYLTCTLLCVMSYDTICILPPSITQIHISDKPQWKLRVYKSYYITIKGLNNSVSAIMINFRQNKHDCNCYLCYVRIWYSETCL